MNSIHVKLEQEEAIAMKKDALILEKELLETLGHIENYNSLRKKEFAIKIQLKKDLSFIESHLNSIQEQLPLEEMSMIKKQDTKHALTQPKQMLRTIEKKQTNVEQELDEIKRKLAALG